MSVEADYVFVGNRDFPTEIVMNLTYNPATGANYPFTDLTRRVYQDWNNVSLAFNGMRSLHHREPGPVPAALDAGVPCELINDGVHVHPGAARLLVRGAAETVVLITDAIDATGVGDGVYALGGQDVVVQDGQARLVSNGSLAGSTLTMDVAFRRAVREVGMSVSAASLAASGTPARLLGLADRCGAIAAGLDADLVHLDDDLNLTRVMTGGRWLS